MMELCVCVQASGVLALQLRAKPFQKTLELEAGHMKFHFNTSRELYRQ